MARITIATTFKHNPQQINEYYVADENAACDMVELLNKFEQAMNAHSDTRFHVSLELGVKRHGS